MVTMSLRLPASQITGETEIQPRPPLDLQPTTKVLIAAITTLHPKGSPLSNRGMSPHLLDNGDLLKEEEGITGMDISEAKVTHR